MSIQEIKAEQEEMNNAFLAEVNQSLTARGDATVTSLTPNSFFKILSAVFAPVVWGLRRLIDKRIRGLYPVYAETAEEVEALLGLYGLAQIRSGTKAGAVVTATVSDVNGYRLAKDTEFYIGDLIYLSTADKLLTSGDNTFSVVAKLEGGAYNLNAGTVLIPQSPIAEISKFTAGLISGGAEAETVAHAKLRLLTHIRAVRTGGTANDYVLWAQEIEGVKNVFVLGNEPLLGEVTVLFTVNSFENYIPSQEIINKVKENIEKNIVLGSAVHVSAPLKVEFNVTISNLTGSAKVADIQTALKKYLFENTAPNKTIYGSELSAVISEVAGEAGHRLISPLGGVVTGKNQVHVLGQLVVQ